MDIFRFDGNLLDTFSYSGGILLPRNLKVTWTERYSRAGSFEISGTPDKNLTELLPVGSMISHVNTNEVMIVEDHEVKENYETDDPDEVVVTGRSFEAVLEDRAVGMNLVRLNESTPYPGGVAKQLYAITAGYLADQIRSVIRDHTDPLLVVDYGDSIPGLSVFNEVPDSGEQVQRPVERGNLYSSLLDLLDLQNLGMQARRPYAGGHSDGVGIYIVAGEDRSSQVGFYHASGGLASAQYYWSRRQHKTAALVSGTWVEVLVDTVEDTAFDRRMMVIDAKYVDEAYDVPPTGAFYTEVTDQLRTIGEQALAGQRAVELAELEVLPNLHQARYRIDYNLGDLVGVGGRYETDSVMRVTEHVEILDDTGLVSYPTLSKI